MITDSGSDKENYYGMFSLATIKYLRDLEPPKDFFTPWEREKAKDPVQQAYVTSPLVRAA